VAIGLLLLSVSAATTLAEERVRGSPDVLLATPLPTRSIVWGKWWGTFRSVPALAVLPGLIAGSYALFHHGHWESPVLLVGLVLAYGATLASLGLALATWIPRLGRAVAATVATYVVVTVGVFFLFLSLWNDDIGAGLAVASPFFGPIYAMIAFMERGGLDRDTGPFWLRSWVILYALAAGLLAWATLATFDRCLGRVPDRPRWPHPPARPRPAGFGQGKEKPASASAEW
jgi:ABC-type transport system involved in multi-copper enzyme maturation permease subunit